MHVHIVQICKYKTSLGFPILLLFLYLKINQKEEEEEEEKKKKETSINTCQKSAGTKSHIFFFALTKCISVTPTLSSETEFI